MSAAWLWRAKQAHGLDSQTSVIDFGGPQQLDCDADAWRAFARRWIKDDHRAEPLLAAIETVSGATGIDGLKGLYRMFGWHDYAAIDLIDPAADFIHDLNYPYEPSRQFDVVTNFGTVEHIFNVGEGFRTIHNLTAPGGLMVHVLPTYGGYYHGFYNVHSVLFRSIAVANNYDLLDMAYAHDISYENDRFLRGFEFQLDDITSTEVRKQHLKFFWYYFSSVLLDRERTLSLIHVVLRKTDDQPFKYPQQINKYALPAS